MEKSQVGLGRANSPGLPLQTLRCVLSDGTDQVVADHPGSDDGENNDLPGSSRMNRLEQLNKSLQMTLKKHEEQISWLLSMVQQNTKKIGEEESKIREIDLRVEGLEVCKKSLMKMKPHRVFSGRLRSVRCKVAKPRSSAPLKNYEILAAAAKRCPDLRAPPSEVMVVLEQIRKPNEKDKLPDKNKQGCSEENTIDLEKVSVITKGKEESKEQSSGRRFRAAEDSILSGPKTRSSLGTSRSESVSQHSPPSNSKSQPKHLLHSKLMKNAPAKGCTEKESSVEPEAYSASDASSRHGKHSQSYESTSESCASPTSYGRTKTFKKKQMTKRNDPDPDFLPGKLKRSSLTCNRAKTSINATGKPPNSKFEAISPIIGIGRSRKRSFEEESDLDNRKDVKKNKAGKRSSRDSLVHEQMSDITNDEKAWKNTSVNKNKNSSATSDCESTHWEDEIQCHECFFCKKQYKNFQKFERHMEKCQTRHLESNDNDTC